jgi:hypothetical protein
MLKLVAFIDDIIKIFVLDGILHANIEIGCAVCWLMLVCFLIVLV